jgi:hypothetical protein
MITDTMCFFTPSVKDDVSTKTLGGRSWGCKSWDQVGIRCILSQLCPNCECMYYYFANPKRTIKYDPTSCTSMDFNLRRRRRIYELHSKKKLAQILSNNIIFFSLQL